MAAAASVALDGACRQKTGQALWLIALSLRAWAGKPPSRPAGSQAMDKTSEIAVTTQGPRASRLPS